jgi:glycine betaine/proline transport system substrate-binding protein
MRHAYAVALSGAVSLAVIALCSAACSSSSSSAAPPKPLIKMAHNDWLSANLNDAIAQILLQEKMGYQVELDAAGTSDQFPKIASGELHVTLEVWPSGHPDDIKSYIDDQKTIERLGPLGPVAQVGWVIPTYLLTLHPELATWQGLASSSSATLFETAASGAKGQFLGGDPSWVQWDQKIIDNLGLDFTVVFANSEAGELSALDTAYGSRNPLLFYLWTPHWAFAEYDLTMVQLPEYNPDCWAQQKCAYPPDNLFKMSWPGLATYAPDVYAFFKAFQYTTQDQTLMMDAVHRGASVEDTARKWVDANEAVWRPWIPQGK